MTREDDDIWGTVLMLNHFKLSRKLGLAFAAVVATIIAMSSAIYWNLQRLEEVNAVHQATSRALDLIGGAEFRLARQENSYRGYLISGDPYYLERLQSHRNGFDKYLQDLRASQAGHENEAEMAGRVDAVLAAMDAWQKQVVDAGVRLYADPINRFKALEMVGRNGHADGLMEPIEDILAAMEADERAEAEAATALRDGAMLFTETALWVGVAMAVVIAAALGFMLSRMIATPVTALTSTMGRLAAGDNSVDVPAVKRGDEIGEMAKAVLVFKQAAIEKIRLEEQTQRERASHEEHRTQSEAEKAREAEQDDFAISGLGAALSALAEGDLTYRITDRFAPKTQKLKDDFNRTAQQLQDTMSQISEAVGAMRSGTGEISQAADDLSRRTEQQAASLEETAAALDEITATVRKTAEGAHQASEVTAHARAEAAESGAVVREAVSAMAQIEKSSQQIGQIIGVIDEIAFQTNLLALNAGVEAARAGEAGRGFAVVASEVRALAQRSAEAAKEIKELISTSTQQVDQGVDLVGKTGAALEKIVAQVAEITGLATEIAASAREQSTGLAEVNTAVNQMDQVTQQNAAMVEQSTAASHKLAQEADELARLVARFRLGQHGDAGSGVRRMVAPANSPRPAPRPAAPRLVPSPAGSQAAALLPQPAGDDGWEEF